MAFCQKAKADAAYADSYSRLQSYSGTRYLTVRDAPALITKYVKGTTALDYGCGAGLSSRFLKTLGFEVEGVDINKYILEKAKEADPTGKYFLIQSGEIPANNDHYDLVNANCVLVNVATKEELLKITRDIARVLKVEGTFIAVVNGKDMYNSNVDWNSADSRFEENRWAKSGSQVKLFLKDIGLVVDNYYWSEEDYYEVIEKAGLTVVHIHNPLGKDSDGIPWTSEYEKIYVSIIIAQKLV